MVLTLVTEDLGRPRFTGAAASFACHSALERSGASSESIQTFAVDFLFPVIGFSQTYDASCRTAGCPYDNDHPPGEPANADVPNLTIILPVILDGNRRALEDISSLRHVETPVLKGRVTFGLSEFNFQLSLLQKIITVNSTRPTDWPWRSFTPARLP